MPEQRSLSPADAVAAAYDDGKTHLILAASGSVATIKIPLIISNLTSSSSPHYIQNLSIRVILTKAAAHFFNGTSAEQPSLATLASLPSVEAVYQDEDEMSDSWIRGAGILHINLRKWADMLVIAPLSANTLAKIVNGLCDGLLTNLIRAWDTSGLVDGKKKRIVVFPAMNAAMFLQPITEKHLSILENEWGVRGVDEGEEAHSKALSKGWFEVFRPIEKSLACGDVGIGGMREWGDIVAIVKKRLDNE